VTDIKRISHNKCMHADTEPRGAHSVAFLCSLLAAWFGAGDARRYTIEYKRGDNMAAPKTQTLQQRFGFQDKDLTTPKHDEILQWLDSDLLNVLKSIGIINIIKHRQQSAIENGVKAACSDEIIKSAPVLSEDYDISMIKITKIWEVPIRNKSYVIGFVDFRAIIKFPITCVVESLSGNFYGSDRYKWSLHDGEIIVNFEVKSTIPSLGELFRQIQMYKVYDKNPFVIVCPDDRFRDQIESQGLKFVKYNDV